MVRRKTGRRKYKFLRRAYYLIVIMLKTGCKYTQNFSQKESGTISRDILEGQAKTTSFMWVKGFETKRNFFFLACPAQPAHKSCLVSPLSLPSSMAWTLSQSHWILLLLKIKVIVSALSTSVSVAIVLDCNYVYFVVFCTVFQPQRHLLQASSNSLQIWTGMPWFSTMFVFYFDF